MQHALFIFRWKMHFPRSSYGSASFLFLYIMRNTWDNFYSEEEEKPGGSRDYNRAAPDAIFQRASLWTEETTDLSIIFLIISKYFLFFIIDIPTTPFDIVEAAALCLWIFNWRRKQMRMMFFLLTISCALQRFACSIPSSSPVSPCTMPKTLPRRKRLGPRNQWDPLHPGPIAQHISPSHIDAELIRYEIYEKTSKIMKAWVKVPSIKQIEVSCDACAKKHSSKNPLCSANKNSLPRKLKGLTLYSLKTLEPLPGKWRRVVYVVPPRYKSGFAEFVRVG